MLHEIKSAIIRDAKEEGEAALQKAEAELEAELVKVKSDGEAMVKAAEEEAKRIVENERRERLSWAKLEAKRILAEAKEDAVNSALQSLLELMKDYVGTTQYAQKIKEKISSAVSEMSGKATVHVRKTDKKLFQLPRAVVVGDAEIIGGAIVESKDGKLRIDLSIEALMDANRDAIRKDIYDRLFPVSESEKSQRQQKKK